MNEITGQPPYSLYLKISIKSTTLCTVSILSTLFLHIMETKIIPVVFTKPLKSVIGVKHHNTLTMQALEETSAALKINVF